MIASKISSKGQITLPRAVRRALNAGPGDRVYFVVEHGGVTVRALGPCTADDLAGSLARYAKPGANKAKVRQLVSEEVARAAAQEG